MPKILIVDDDRDFLESMTAILEESGYSYIATADSKTVEKKVRNYRPNLVILDVFLNDDDGASIAAELKKTFDTQSIPILLVSGIRNMDEVSQTIAVEGYLQKPFNSSDLCNLISDLVIKKQTVNLL